MVVERILVVDVGGAHTKCCLMPDRSAVRTFVSGPDLTPARMIERLATTVADWRFDGITFGLPTPIRDDIPTLEPHNLGGGWNGFDLRAAFDAPVKVVNDAAMQAIGSYNGGKMLFLGLGTGLGAALVAEPLCIALELAHMPYKDGKTYEDHVGTRGIEAHGTEQWLGDLEEVIEILRAGMVADYVVLGGGNARLTEVLGPNVRKGNNERAFIGGYRLWVDDFKVL